MATHLQDTIAECQRLSSTHPRVLVGLSGGKDSLATLDLALRFFPHVVCWHNYFVPGLKFEEEKVARAEAKFRVTVVRVPMMEVLGYMRDGFYCDQHKELDDLLVGHTQRDFYDWLKRETNTTLVLTGEKKADGPFRRMRMGNQKNTMSDFYYPLKHWKTWEVLSYLHARNIEIPNAETGDSSAIDLVDYEILHLYDHHREDYDRLIRFFPYAACFIYRREWFGIGGRARQANSGVSGVSSH